MIERASSKKLIPWTMEARAKWLLRRRQGVGASDAAVILNLSKWKTPYQLWHDKAGLLPLGDMSEEQLFGLLHEPMILEMYAARTGQEVFSCPEFMYEPGEPWRYANPDGVTRTRLVQAKQSWSREGWGREGTDDIPIDYRVQVNQEMGVCGADLCDVPVLFGGNQMRVYTVAYDKVADEEVKHAEWDFWRMVERRVRPAIDYRHQTTLGFLEEIHTPVPQERKVGDFGDDALVTQYQDWVAELKQTADRVDEFRGRIVEQMGSAAVWELLDGTEVHRLSKSGKPLFRIAKAKGVRDE